MRIKPVDAIIVGAGAVGLSVAYKIAAKHPALNLIVLDKERKVAGHQTGNNSGVIHSGVYYKPGSLKARLCISGREELVEFAKEYEVPAEVCGKVVAAATEDELTGLEKIFRTGNENGLTEIEMWDERQIHDREPFCRAIKGIYVPHTGIIDYVAMCERLAERVKALGENNLIFTGQEVRSIRDRGGMYELQTQKATFSAKYLITCAGLQSDRMARMEGLRPQTRIVPFRGDYYELTDAAKHKVKHLIYPVPNPAFPFLGVHFTRMTNGEIECGPSAVFSFKREGYGKTSFDLRDTLNALSYSGSWKLFADNWKFGLNEYKRAFSKEAFLGQLQRLLPSLRSEDLRTGRSGVRAMALNPDGSMVDDFAFERHERSLHVLNAPSPAATACLAIGEEIRLLAEKSFNW